MEQISKNVCQHSFALEREQSHQYSAQSAEGRTSAFRNGLTFMLSIGGFVADKKCRKLQFSVKHRQVFDRGDYGCS